MILLLTAQTMGWCRAYVCDGSGMPEITMANHCHEAGRDDAEHDHSEHPAEDRRGCECSPHHDHELMSAAFSATEPRNDEARALAGAILAVTALLPPPEIQRPMPKVDALRLHSGGWSGRPLSCQMRLTVALLI